MKKIKPGMTVEWSRQGRPKIVGRVISNTGQQVRLLANGKTYEVSPDVLREPKSCIRCNKPFTHLSPFRQDRQQFCSEACYLASIKSDCDNWVFDAIVEYKRANDGNSPDLPWLAERSGFCQATVVKSIRRMVEQGRLIAIGKTKNRAYIIPGARWTYEAKVRP